MGAYVSPISSLSKCIDAHLQFSRQFLTLIEMTNPPLITSFVISPFGEPFDTYFSHIIKPALEECGLFAVRGDSLYRPTTIVDDIWQGIRDAKLLIAELTDRNPNVFYELGLAHAISKPVILIARSIEDVPFDLRSIRVLVYDKDHPDWGHKLRVNLTKAIKEVIQSPATAIPTTFKLPVKSNIPEEPETLMRLEALESTVHRLVGKLDDNTFDTLEDEKYPAFKEHKTLNVEVGQTVIHPKFGAGEVLSVEGNERGLRAQINFKKSGVKLLDLSIAKLEVIPF